VAFKEDAMRRYVVTRTCLLVLIAAVGFVVISSWPNPSEETFYDVPPAVFTPPVQVEVTFFERIKGWAGLFLVKAE
jgi:hypothetical protein